GDYERFARLEARVGNYPLAVAEIDKAIASWPGSPRLYDRRRDYEIGNQVDPRVAELHRTRGYHERADFYARSGDDENALRAYVDAFRLAAKLPDDDASSGVELGSTTAGFSGFLARRFGRDLANAWWQSIKASPIASPREQQLADAEARRLAATP